MDNCTWCSVGISSDEKFCSQCGGPNVNFSDLAGYAAPITNIGERVITYTRTLRAGGTDYWEFPKDGILRRVILTTPKKLLEVRIVENKNYVRAQVKPKTNEYIYTGEIFLQNWNTITELQIWSSFNQDATIVLETDSIKENYQATTRGGVYGFVRALQGR